MQLSLFDQADLAGITSPDFPGERLIACCNPLLAELATRCRVKTRLKADPHGPPLSQLTQPNPLQKQALQLLGLPYSVSGNAEQVTIPCDQTVTSKSAKELRFRV